MKSQYCWISLFICSILSAQPETHKWYFGKFAGLDFSTSTPGVLTGAMRGGEGCASIADAGGNLLFYTSGDTIWNNQHQVMANGSGLAGSFSSTQAAIIIRKPGSQHLYYVFTTGAGLNYSVVDMNLAGGLGSVTTAKNVLLYDSVTEQMSAVRHCNGTDVWIMSHEYHTNKFCAYLLSAAGVNTLGVTSAVGAFTPSASVGSSMKFSPNGRKIGQSVKTAIYLFDFDPATGIVSNPIKFGGSFGGTWVYGVEFSPDGTKLYGTTNRYLFQWSLCPDDSQSVANSQVKVYDSGINLDPSLFMAQLASDGKIYVASAGSSSLGVINAPNNSGALCNFVPMQQSISPHKCGLGLPGFICSAFAETAPAFTYSLDCMQVGFQASAPYNNNSNCTAPAYSVSGTYWHFGDPASGNANTSTQNNPVHQFSAPGKYLVKLVYNTACGSDTLYQFIQVGGPPQVSVQVPVICAGNAASITTGASEIVNWYAGATSATALTSGSLFVTPILAAGTYTYYLSTSGCTLTSARKPFTLQVNAHPTLSVSPQQSTICLGNSVAVAASGALTYSWSHGAQQDSVMLSPSATNTYVIYGTDQNGCSDSAKTVVYVAACLAVGEYPSDVTPRAFPVPGHRSLVVVTKGRCRAILASSEGRLVAVYELEDGKNELDTSALSAGVYFLKSEKWQKALKIVVD